MKSVILASVLFFGLLQPAQARWYGGVAFSNLNADFRNVDIGPSEASVSGSMEIIGVQGGWENMSAGNLGADVSLAILGANSQKLSPDPNWGIPWFYRITAKGNYM